MKYYKNFLAYHNTLSLNNYVFAAFLFSMIIASVCSIFGNVLTNYPMSANIKWVLSIILSALGFYLLRRDKFIELFKSLLLLAILFLVVWPSWFYGGGDNAITILYMLLISVETLLIFENPVMRWVFVVLCASSCIMLFTITYQFPHLVQTTTVQNVFIDNIIQVLIIFILTVISVDIYTRRYVQQHKLLSQANGQLETLASIDVLTNVYTRRKILEQLETAFANQKNTLFIAMIDIDRFKDLNDEYGHVKGDCIIQHFANYIDSIVGTSGKVGRYGGDEFMVLFENIPIEEIKALAERMICIPPYEAIAVHMSCGIAPRLANDTMHQLISRSDHLLMESKRHGRSQIRLFGDTVISSTSSAA